MKEKIIKIINWTLTGLLAFVVLFILGSRLPIPGNYQILVVQSGSMEPTIKTGAIVVVKPQTEYQVSDIITFKSGRNNVTHRIIEINGTEISTKGDANDSADINPIARRNIEGRVLLDVPWLGYLVAASQQPIGFLFLIVVPALYIIISESIKVVKEIKKKKDENKS